MLAPWKKSYDQPRQHIKKHRHHFAHKGPSSQSCGFSSSHVWMWQLDHKENWAPKNWCYWTVMLEKTLESPLDCKEIKPVHPKGNQPWIFIGRTMLNLKLQYFGHLMRTASSLEKTLMVGKSEGRRRRGHRKLDEWMASPNQWIWVWASSGWWWRQGSLVCCNPQGHKSWTWLSNWTTKSYNVGLATDAGFWP